MSYKLLSKLFLYKKELKSTLQLSPKVLSSYFSDTLSDFLEYQHTDNNKDALKKTGISLIFIILALLKTQGALK